MKKKLYKEQCEFISSRYPDLYQELIVSYEKSTKNFVVFIFVAYIAMLVVVFSSYQLIVNQKSLSFILFPTFYIVMVQVCYLKYSYKVKKELFMQPYVKKEIYEEMVEHIMNNKKLAQ